MAPPDLFRPRCVMKEACLTNRSLRLLSDDELVARVKDHAAREPRDVELIVLLAELETPTSTCGPAMSPSSPIAGRPSASPSTRPTTASRRRGPLGACPVILDLLAEGMVNPHEREATGSAPDSRQPPRGPGVRLVGRGRRKSRRSWPGSPRARTPASVSGSSRRRSRNHHGRPTPSTAAPHPTSPPPAPPAVSATPSSPDRYKLQLTIGRETLAKLRLAKDLLRHAIPTGDDAAILDRALAALLADLARKNRRHREAAPLARRRLRDRGTSRPRSRRAVWLRDLGLLRLRREGGRRFGERGFLEFHVRPAGRGRPRGHGPEHPASPCRRHNDTRRG